MSNVGPSCFYVRDNAPTSTIGWSAVTAWAASTSIAAGVLRRQLTTPSVGNERVFVCIVAGTTNSTEPTWVVTKGALTTDNTVTWQECTGQPGVNGDITNCPTWLQNKNVAVTLGMIIENAATTYLFICSTAGTTGSGSEPSWTLTAGVTTADNTVTWTCIGANSFSAWAAPHARLANAFASGWAGAGNSVYVGDDHAETQSTSMTIGAPAGCAALCVDHTVMSPTTANLKTTATISTTGNSGLTVNGGATPSAYYYGLIFNCGTGANGPTLAVAHGTQVCLDACSLRMLGTSAGVIQFGNGSDFQYCIANNTTMQFGSTLSSITVRNGIALVWKNTASALLGSTYPGALFFSNTGFSSGGTALLDGIDLSAPSSLVICGTGNQSCQIALTNCKLPATTTLTSSAGTALSHVDLINCDSSATNYREQRGNVVGSQIQDTGVVRTNGASNGTTSLSWKIVTTTSSLWWGAFECHQIGIWNTVTGSTVTCTLHGIWSSASLPNNDDIWMDIEYMGSSASPMASFASGTKANTLATGTAQTADSISAWDSLATARANSTAYTTASIIKLASNPGRLFFCTVAGTSTTSEPGGYASAVDGGSVTDGGATFRAGTRFSMAVVLSSPQPQIAGDLYVIVRAAKPSSTWWVDPLCVLS